MKRTRKAETFFIQFKTLFDPCMKSLHNQLARTPPSKKKNIWKWEKTIFRPNNHHLHFFREKWLSTVGYSSSRKKKRAGGSGYCVYLPCLMIPIGSLKNIFLKCGSNAEQQLSRSRSSIVNDNQILVFLFSFLLSYNMGGKPVEKVNINNEQKRSWEKPLRKQRAAKVGTDKKKKKRTNGREWVMEQRRAVRQINHQIKHRL